MTVDLPLLRQSERGSFKRCPLQWWWGWHMGLRKKGPAANALWFGTGVHLALSEWYIPGVKRGVDPRETWAVWADKEIRSIKVVATRDAISEETVTAYVDARKLGLQVFDRYLNEYGQDEHMDMVSSEQTFSVRIPHPVIPGEAIVILKGTFDGVHRDLRDGLFYLDETKTAMTISTDHLPIDDQAGTYWAVATHTLRRQELIGPKDELAGIIYNFLRKAENDERPMNSDGKYTNKPTKAHYIEALWNSRLPAVKQALLGRQIRYLEKFTAAQLIAVAEKYGVAVLGEVSKVQPPPYFLREQVDRTPAERNGQIRRIGAEVMAMNRFRDLTQPMYKTPRYDCKRFCDFFDLCELHEQDADLTEHMDALYYREDMYAAHRPKSTAE